MFNFRFYLRTYVWVIAVVTGASALSACGGAEQSNFANPQVSTGMENGTADSNLTNRVGTLSLLAGRLGGSGNLNGRATNARFMGPMRLVVDRTGNVLVSDWTSHIIRKVSPSQEVTTYAGVPGVYGADDGDRLLAKFNHPGDMVVDLDNNLIIADAMGQSIRKIDVNGKVSTVLRKGDSGLAVPEALSFDRSGNLYILSSDQITQSSIIVVPRQGLPRILFEAKWRYVSPSIAVDSAQNIYVSSGNDLHKITPDGATSTWIRPDGTISAWLDFANISSDSPAQSSRFHPITISQDDSLFVDFATMVLKISTRGEISKIKKSTYASVGVDGISIDVQNNLFMTDSELCSVLKMDQAGNVTLYAGLPRSVDNQVVDGKAENAKFNRPTSLTSDMNGNLYLIDDQDEMTGNEWKQKSTFAIRKISHSGEVTTLHKLPFNYFFSDSRFFGQASGLNLDVDGNFYFYIGGYCPVPLNCTNTGVGLWKLNGAGQLSKLFSDDDFRFAQQIVFDQQKNAYLMNPHLSNIQPYIERSGMIWQIEPNGSRHLLGNQADNSFSSIEVNSKGQVYAIRSYDFLNVEIVKFRSDGSFISVFKGDVGNMVFDLNDNLYVTSKTSILKIRPDGVSSVLLGDNQKTGVSLGRENLSLGSIQGMRFVAPNLLYIVSENSVLKYVLP